MSELETVANNIKLTIVASNTIVNLHKLDSLYKLTYGTYINYQKFGFKSLYDLLQSIPNHIKIIKHGSNIELIPLLSSNFADLESLITSKNSSKKNFEKRSRAIFVQDQNSVNKEITKPLKIKSDLDLLKELESEICGEQTTTNNEEKKIVTKSNDILPNSTSKQSNGSDLLKINTSKKSNTKSKTFFNNNRNKIHFQNSLPRLDSLSFNPLEIVPINVNYKNSITKENHYVDKKVDLRHYLKKNSSKVKVPLKSANNNHDDDKKGDLLQIINEQQKIPDNNTDKEFDLQQTLDEIKNVENSIQPTISPNVTNNDNGIVEKKGKKSPSIKKKSGYFYSVSQKRKLKGIKNTASSYLEKRLENQNRVTNDGKKISYIPNSLRNNLNKLFDVNPNGIWLANFMDVYKKSFSENLRKYMGSASILDFCNDNDDVFKLIRPGICDWLVFSVNQQIPDNIQNIVSDDLVFESKCELIPPLVALPEVTDYDVIVIKDNKCNNESSILHFNSKNEYEGIKNESDIDSPIDNLMDYPPNVLTDNDEIESQWVYYKPDFWFEVNVLEIFTPSKFWMNVSKYDCFKNIISEIQKYYEVQHKCYQMKKCHMNINQYCVIRYQEKNKSIFRRAKIINCLHNIDVVEVFLIDYGFIMDCPIGDMFYLKKTFSKYPQQAVRAKLYNIKPFDESWEMKAVDKFMDLTHKIHLIATVKVAHQNEKIIEVVLKSCDKQNNKVDIGEKLVKLDLAKYITDNKVVKEYISFKNIEDGRFPSRSIIADKNEPMNVLFLKFMFSELVKKKNCQILETNCLPQLENCNSTNKESEFQNELEYFFKKFQQSDSDSDSDSNSYSGSDSSLNSESELDSNSNSNTDSDFDSDVVYNHNFCNKPSIENAMNKKSMLDTVLLKNNLDIKRCSSSDSDNSNSEENIKSNNSYFDNNLKNSQISLCTISGSADDDDDNKSSDGTTEENRNYNQLLLPKKFANIKH